MSIPTYKQVKNYKNKSYKRVELNLSIDDFNVLKQYCADQNISMNNYVYNLIIADLAKKGIKLFGTVSMRSDMDASNIIDIKRQVDQKHD